ncbi:hypothetical protein BH10ACT1_BH10ACT1_41180 [soil metagenome]
MLALALVTGSLVAHSAPAGADGSPRTFPGSTGTGARTNVVASPGTVFVPTVPCRVLDTRGTGALASGQSTNVTVTGGTCGIPVAATSVEASISAVTPSGNGFTRVWPTGSTPPSGTVLNYSKGKGATNTGAVAISAAGKLTLKNFSGPANYVIDIQGYYAEQDDIPGSTIGSNYVPLRPCRVLDTRGSGGPLAAGATRNVPVSTTSGCAVPANATGVQASVSAVDPGGTGYARIWPKGAAAPNATSLNFAAGQSSTNTGGLALGTSASLSLQNFGGPANYVVDIQGYFVKFADIPSGVARTEYQAFSPCRFYDSRLDEGASPFLPGDSIGGPMTAQGTGCPIPDGATAAEVSVSAVNPTAPGYARVYPLAGGPPNATSLNYSKGQSTTNTGPVSVDAGGDIELTNYSGTTHYTLDVQGAWVPIVVG